MLRPEDATGIDERRPVRRLSECLDASGVRGMCDGPTEETW
jgi:hypothetical protein